MLFNSYDFLIFFPIVVLLYYLIPKKVRWVWLLFASYWFYMGWNAKYAILLAASTLITYLSGLLLGKVTSHGKAAKCIVACTFLSNLGILFFFKYFNFAIENLNWILSKVGVELITPSFDVLLPVGISFYIFQALSYTMDIYREEVEPERNIFRYALFVSFFPQLVAGPIERSKNLLKQIRETHRFNYRQMCEGLLLMLWGYFLKLMIADRIAIFVDTAFAEDVMYDGKYMLLAVVLFAFQIYCDFAGYTTIAMGAAQILGFRLMDNFNCPYFATSVSDFWRRWHISLSTWFRDYLYIPLGGNRKGKARKLCNLMVVFLASGLWHGANWTYVIWGGLNGIFQVIGELFAPLKKIPIAKPIRALVTFSLIDFSWIFFRSANLAQAGSVISRICNWNDDTLLANGGLYDMGLNKANWCVLLISLLILLVADLLKYHGKKCREMILNSFILVRWSICIVAIVGIIVFSVWGIGHEETVFIYFQF